MEQDRSRCHNTRGGGFFIDVLVSLDLLQRLHLKKRPCSQVLNIHSIRRKAVGLWSHLTLDSHLYVLHSKSPSRTDFVHGGGRFHRWHHPGMPLDVTTFSVVVLEHRRNPKVELLLSRTPSHQSANEQPSSAPIIPLNSTTIENPETTNQHAILYEYLAFQNVLRD